MYYSLFVCNGKWDYFFDYLSDFSLLVHRNATYLFFIRVEKEKKQKRNKQGFPSFCEHHVQKPTGRKGHMVLMGEEGAPPGPHCSFTLETTLFCEGCHNKIPKTGWFKQQKFISHSSGVWKSKVKVKVGLVSPEAFLLGL